MTFVGTQGAVFPVSEGLAQVSEGLVPVSEGLVPVSAVPELVEWRRHHSPFAFLPSPFSLRLSRILKELQGAVIPVSEGLEDTR